uniref:Sepiapterin reductase n=1 Tax=Seriola dumerili TaxID=41447 RepID=A0A3B4VG60_SERDU
MSSTDSRDLAGRCASSPGPPEASAGLQRREMSRLVKPRSVLVLVARTGDDLRFCRRSWPSLRRVERAWWAECVVADLGQTEGVESVVRASKVFLTVWFFITEQQLISDFSRFNPSTNMAEVNSYLSLNVSSCLCLTASILAVSAGVQSLDLRPFRSWGLYCTGKAAEDMIFKVLAEEGLNVVSLSLVADSGPLDTDMLMEARTRTADPTLRKSFTDMFAQGKVLHCEEWCMLRSTYESGGADRREMQLRRGIPTCVWQESRRQE